MPRRTISSITPNIPLRIFDQLDPYQINEAKIELKRSRSRSKAEKPIQLEDPIKRNPTVSPEEKVESSRNAN